MLGNVTSYRNNSNQHLIRTSTVEDRLIGVASAVGCFVQVGKKVYPYKFRKPASPHRGPKKDPSRYMLPPQIHLMSYSHSPRTTSKMMIANCCAVVVDAVAESTAVTMNITQEKRRKRPHSCRFCRVATHTFGITKMAMVLLVFLSFPSDRSRQLWFGKFVCGFSPPSGPVTPVTKDMPSRNHSWKVSSAGSRMKVVKFTTTSRTTKTGRSLIFGEGLSQQSKENLPAQGSSTSLFPTKGSFRSFIFVIIFTIGSLLGAYPSIASAETSTPTTIQHERRMISLSSSSSLSSPSSSSYDHSRRQRASLSTTNVLIESIATTTSTTMLSSSSLDGGIEQQLRESLKAPTTDKPQIPLPSMPTPSSESTTTSSTTQKPDFNKMNTNVPMRGTKTPNRSDDGTVQALVSIEYGGGGGQQSRPLGNELLVVKAWNGLPSSLTSSATSTSNNEKQIVLLGGAKIPMAKVGSLPIRVILGTQNSIPSGSSSSSSSGAERIGLWKEYTTGQDLWLQAGICQPTTSEHGNIAILPSEGQSFWSSSTSSSDFCPPEDYKLRFGGESISKWIALPSAEQGTMLTEDDTTLSSSAGIRAPASIVLRPVGVQ